LHFAISYQPLSQDERTCRSEMDIRRVRAAAPSRETLPRDTPADLSGERDMELMVEILINESS